MWFAHVTCVSEFPNSLHICKEAILCAVPKKERWGVVALWNSNARTPVGVQFEVMDMIYGLEAKDWMRIDTDRG